MLVAVAYGSTIAATSPDGINWTQRAIPAGYWVSIAYGNDIFVAVGDNTNNLVTSPDGITWTTRTLPTHGDWRSITYGNGLFVAITLNSTIAASSPDGINWTQRTLPVTTNWQSITFGNGIFVAVSKNSSTIATSTDGITWTQRALPSNSRWTSVTYGNGLFVVVSDGFAVVATSPDGIAWTQRSLPSVEYWKSVICGDGMFIIVSLSPATAKSSDGITWALERDYDDPRITPIDGGTHQFQSVFGPGYGFSTAKLIGGAHPYLYPKMVAVHAERLEATVVVPWANSVVSSSTDNGVTWSPLTNFNLQDKLASAGVLSSSGVNKIKVTGPDAAGVDQIFATFTVDFGAGTPSIVGGVAVSYEFGLFVVIKPSSNKLVTSPDGVSWTERTLPIEQDWQAIASSASIPPVSIGAVWGLPV